MPEVATTFSTDHTSALDALIPPPGPRWRRVLGWALFLGVVGTVGWLWGSGTATPQLSSHGGSWGGEGPVHLGIDIRNESRVAVEVVEGPADRDGLTLLGYQVVRAGDAVAPPATLDPFPLRLEPGATVQLVMIYGVADCDAIDAQVVDDQVDFGVRIAEGPFTGRTETVEVDAPGFVDSGASESWPATVTQYACP